MSQKPLTLLERKRLQWDKEKEELIGLCTPWGRPPSLKLSTSCTSLTEGMKNLSTNLNKNGQPIGNKRTSNPGIIPSSYLQELGLLASSSQSEYHLPPIGLEKQKGQESDGFRELPNINKGNPIETPHWFNRKRSLPSCILTTTGEVCSQTRNFGQEETVHQNNNIFHHGNEKEMVMDEKYYRHYRNSEKRSFEKWSNNSSQYHQEEDPHTSGYQSENNPVNSEGSDDSRNGTGDSDKDPQLLRRYFSNANMAPGSLKLTPQDAYVYTSEVDYYNQNPNGWSKPGSYLYSKRNEMDHYEIEQSESRYMTKSNEAESLQQKTWSYVNSRIHIPPPAMRSSFTNSIDAPDKDAYKDIKKQEHEKWLRELEQQRDEQRLRKLMEKEEKTGRAKWGDRGVVVGHLWEPASLPDARLPPGLEGEGNSPRSGPNDGHEFPPPRWSETSQYSDIFDERSNRVGLGMTSSDHAEAEAEASERGQKMQKAMQHQEAIRKQIEERQQKLKEAQERRVEEERVEEAKILTYRLEQLRKLEFDQRQQLIRQQETETQNGTDIIEINLESQRKPFSREDNENLRVFQKQQEIENSYLMRKNLTTSFTLPLINPLESPAAASPNRRRSISPFEEYEATVLKENFQSATLSSPAHRNTNTLESGSPIRQDFGTQTEPKAEGQESTQSIIERHPQNTAETEKESHQLTKSTQEEVEADTNGKKMKRKKERPKWGVPPPTKQYLKQSEKDPYYQLRLQRRRDRQKRREDQLKFVKASMMLDNDGKADESEDSQNQNQGKISKPKPKFNLKSKQKSLINVYATNKEAHFSKKQNIPQMDVRNEREEENPRQETYSTLPKMRKRSTPAQRDAVTLEVARDTADNGVHHPLRLPSPSIENLQVSAEVEGMEDSMSGVELRQTDSPPVPALMNKMHQSMEAQPAGINWNSFSLLNEDENDDHRKVFGRIPIQNPSHENISQSPRMSSKSPAPKRNGSSDDSDQDSDEESGIPPKVSPATLVIESSADYFTRPLYLDSSRSSVKSEQTSSYYNPVPLGSPPAQLKQLLYGIQNLGNYLPLTPGKQLVCGESELFSSDPNQSHPNRTIEFTIKFPAGYCRHFQGVDSESRKVDSLQIQMNQNDVEEYMDPLLEEKKKSTIDWIHSNSSQSSSNDRDVLTHLSTMKRGIRNQQEEWGVVPSDSEIGASPYGSSFYPSSERSSSSN